MFIPLLFMSGIVGRPFHEFAMTVEHLGRGIGFHRADADADDVRAVSFAPARPDQEGRISRAFERFFDRMMAIYDTRLDMGFPSSISHADDHDRARGC